MSTPPRPDTPPPTSGTTSNKAKVIVWMSLLAVVLAGVIALLAVKAQSTTEPTSQTGPPEAPQVVRPDSRVLSQAPNEQAVLVEFLDFECEGCAAAYPVVEELRADYTDTVTFVHRYFPLPGHPNSMTAAVAVEAAAQQDAYEAMYQKMFETQEQWSHAAQDQSPVFRDYAQDLGLDLAAYDAAVADPATTARVEADVAEGITLGVQGTPTFFLDGRPLTLDTVEQFRAELDAAVAN
ncbi:DsbA family protein [Enteractinococcus helveticum]|uniref:Disulfide bond formation protein DsbA n=1 Tax=Enteractinococcus helveticum TaxID=1837282 RepID=A0A1B7LYS0_9MICC|nr:thioredoxin domain-containing protein [Enteractinococcus helveticum]OAV60477.1 disulfide bond formation protein DsbA [Enteractinococcus helveticum]